MLPISGETTATGVPKLLEGAKLAFVLALRQAFASTLTSENLRYDADGKKTKIKIFTAHPLKVEFRPALIVSAAGGDCSFKYLQDDFTNEDTATETIEYAGQLSFNISITVMSESTVERERIIDHLIFYIRHIFVDTFRCLRSGELNFNLTYTKDLRLGSENIVEIENKPVYEQTLDIPCYLEYKATVDQKKLDTLRIINISNYDLNTLDVSSS